MSVDLTKLILDSDYPGFHNNTKSTGSFAISGSYTAGVNVKTFQFILDVTPDLSDILFNSSSIELAATYAGGSAITVSNKWVRRGQVIVPASGPSVTSLGFIVSPELNGTTLTFRCYGVNQTVETGTLTSTTVNWRLVDYSVF